MQEHVHKLLSVPGLLSAKPVARQSPKPEIWLSVVVFGVVPSFLANFKEKPRGDFPIPRHTHVCLHVMSIYMSPFKHGKADVAKMGVLPFWQIEVGLNHNQ